MNYSSDYFGNEVETNEVETNEVETNEVETLAPVLGNTKKSFQGILRVKILGTLVLAFPSAQNLKFKEKWRERRGMDKKESVVAVCFAIALLCALVMYPLSAQLISLPSDELASDAYKSKWLLDCVLGVVGLVSAITGKRLSG